MFGRYGEFLYYGVLSRMSKTDGYQDQWFENQVTLTLIVMFVSLLYFDILNISSNTEIKLVETVNPPFLKEVLLFVALGVWL